MKILVTRLRRASLLVGLAGAMSGCILTSKPPRQVILVDTYGQIARVRLPSDVAIGELLALTDSSLLLLRENRVVTVPLRGVTRIEFGAVNSYDVVDGVIQSTHREEVLRRSRFPYGLTPEGLANLLRATGQTQPDVVRPSVK